MKSEKTGFILLVIALVLSVVLGRWHITFTASLVIAAAVVISRLSRRLEIVQNRLTNEVLEKTAVKKELSGLIRVNVELQTEKNNIRLNPKIAIIGSKKDFEFFRYGISTLDKTQYIQVDNDEKLKGLEFKHVILLSREDEIYKELYRIALYRIR